MRLVQRLKKEHFSYLVTLFEFERQSKTCIRRNGTGGCHTGPSRCPVRLKKGPKKLMTCDYGETTSALGVPWPQVYREPLFRRHYGRFFGEAVIFRISILAISIALSLVVAYATGGFWVKLKPDVTQANVHYTYDAVLVFEVSCQMTESSESCLLPLAWNRLCIRHRWMCQSQRQLITWFW